MRLPERSIFSVYLSVLIRSRKDNVMNMMKNAALVIVGFLALFVAAGAIAVVVDAATWDQLGDWTLKAVLVGLIVFAFTAVISVISNISGKKD